MCLIVRFLEKSTVKLRTIEIDNYIAEKWNVGNQFLEYLYDGNRGRNK
jgi:hypothetical protein